MKIIVLSNIEKKMSFALAKGFLINFAKKASTFVVFLICSNETVFFGGGVVFCIFSVVSSKLS